MDKTPTCTEKGSRSRHCKYCTAVTQVTVIEYADHSFTVVITQIPSTCKEQGSVLCSCADCDATHVEKLPLGSLKDSDNNCKCDYCSIDMAVNKCDHICHKDGFMGFVWKIMLFIYKIFNINGTCSCGAAHY